MSLGSGVLVSVDGVTGCVLTNNHVVDGVRGAVTVMFPSGKNYRATIKRRDPRLDLAWLQIVDPGVEPRKIADTEPAINDLCYIAGYGPNGRFAHQTGRLTHYLGSSGGQSDLMQISGCRARQGDSGGPILNAEGYLVGILSSSGRGFTVGCRLGPLRKFLGWIRKPEKAPAIPAEASPIIVVDPPPAPIDMGWVDDIKQSLADVRSQLNEMAKSKAKPPRKIKEKVREKLVAAVVSKAKGNRGFDWGSVLAGLLGVGGPAGVGIGIAGWLLSRAIRRRIKERINVPEGYRDYAQQQAELYTATGGRDALRDQTAGRLYDQEIDKMLTGVNADLFYAMRDRVKRNVERIFTANAQRTTSI